MIRRWLGELNPDDPWDPDAAPTFRWEQDGSAVKFRAVPKNPDSRGSSPNDRAIGVYGHTGVGFIDDAPEIKKALATKHHEYGNLGAPFIVAVGTYIHDRDRWHSCNAMYGHVAIQIGEAPDGSTVARETRRPDGYFGTSPGWANSNVSGVLSVNQLMPYNVQRAETTLWRHPTPDHRLPEPVGLPGDTVSLASNALVEVSNPTTADRLFGLPNPWPPGEAWPGNEKVREASNPSKDCLIRPFIFEVCTRVTSPPAGRTTRPVSGRGCRGVVRVPDLNGRPSPLSSRIAVRGVGDVGSRP